MKRHGGIWKELQLAGWLLFLGYMILTGKDQNYLAPLQHLILLAGGGVLFLVFLVGFLAGFLDPPQPTETIRLDKSGLLLALESVGHWIPMLVVWMMGVTTLNMDLATMRNNIQMRVLDVNRTPEDLSARLRRLKPGEYLEVTHIQLYSNPQLESNVRISLIGRAIRLNAEQHQKAFPDEVFQENRVLFYRFAIACCAADASPLSVFLEGVPAVASLADEGWYRVQGVTRTSRESGPVMVLVDHLEEISAPDKPFLSWLDAM